VKQTSTVAVNAVSVDGSAATCATTCNDSEHILDIIQAISMAPGLSQVRVYVANTAPGTTDVEIFNKMATENIAKQLSCSWGWSPADPNSDDPIFKQFAAQGQTLFVASGDAGAYKSTTLNVYPADDPYVTAVGGTILTTVAAGGAWKSETAWACVSGSTMCGGGGISPNKIAIPSWQTTTGVITKTNLGSTTYRNLPDVAAEANTDNYICYGYNNSTKTATCGSTWGGTSFSAPRWAGILALANQQALSHKDSFTDALLTTTKTATCGFINPALYAAGLSSKASTYFHDITSGSIGTFTAITGFDLVTGWGSPIGSALITLLAP
jgi:subtilase family serine protease